MNRYRIENEWPGRPTVKRDKEGMFVFYNEVKQIQADVKALYEKAASIPPACQRAQFQTVLDGLEILNEELQNDCGKV